MDTRNTPNTLTARSLVGAIWREGRPVPIKAPYDGSLAGYFHESALADVEDAVAAAHKADHDWAATPAHKRAAILQAIARLMNERAEELARTMALQTGKTIREARVETTRSTSTSESVREV